jgi:hypothetical protein
MIRALLTAATLVPCAAACAGAQDMAALLPVPSSQPVTLFEVIAEEDGPVLRYRFLAPRVREYGFETLMGDMQALCETVAVPQVAEADPDLRIVVSLMDREVPFGEPDPDARQHFEAYRVEGVSCIWEVF